MSGQKIPVIQIILAALFIALALFSGSTALYYSAIIFACFAAIQFFAVIAKPKKLSKSEFDELDKKYSGKVLVIDALSLILVLAETAIIYFVFAGLKENAYKSVAQTAVFTSNPQGLLFMAAFLFSISTIGWIIHYAARKIFGSDYWQYYFNRKNVGFDTQKIYGFVSIAALVLAVPALVFGFADYSAIRDNGVHLNNWGKLNPVEYTWSDVLEIQEFAGKENPFYVISFSSKEKWNTSNEKWSAPQEQVIEFISVKSGKEIEKN